MPQDASTEAWAMSSIPSERNNRKSWADSFSLSASPTCRPSGARGRYHLRENIIAVLLT
jgi:hypothetical protein